MKKLLSTLALLLAALPAWAVPTFVSMTIEDLNDSTSETYFDTTPGLISVSSTDSALLSKYWTGSLQVALSNNYDPSMPGEFISSSINLNATDLIGENLVVNILAAGYTNPTGGDYGFDTIINAATVQQAQFDAVVFVDTNVLLDAPDIADTNTRTASGTFTVGDSYSILHAFRLYSDAPGADLGFDISTRANVPEPLPLGLLGAGLLGLGFTVKRRS